MPILHAIFIRFKADTTSAQKEEFYSMGMAMPKQIPELLTNYAGPSMEFSKERNQGFEACVVATFKNEKDMITYMGHKHHKEFQAFGHPLVDHDSALCWDMEVPDAFFNLATK